MDFLFWPDVKKYNDPKNADFSTTFTKLSGYPIYKGISPDKLTCYITKFSLKPNGYVVLPLSMINTDKREYTLEYIECMNKRDLSYDYPSGTGVHGGITYISKEFPGGNDIEDIGDDAAIFGFDTHHPYSPNMASFEFMIEEVFKLSEWVKNNYTT